MAEYCKACGEKLNFFTKVQSRQDICLHCFNEENLARIAASRALKKVSESVDRVFPIDSSTIEVPVRELCSDSESKLNYAELAGKKASIYEINEHEGDPAFII